MVVDAYTQYNQAGIGASITNGGYGQIVSFFTIANEIGVYCGSGGACDITNSNSSFGNSGLVADGVGPVQSNGVIDSNAEAGSTSFEIRGLFNRPYDGQVLYVGEQCYGVEVEVVNGGSGCKPPVVISDSPSEVGG